MMSSMEANRPRWRGEPGFFEIWFLVVFDHARRRAWWLRYTTFADRAGRQRATVWASVFDATSKRTVSGKLIAPIEQFDGGWSGGFGLRIDTCTLGDGNCGGQLSAGGHVFSWKLAFAPASAAAERGPAWLDRLPLPTHVAHANSEIAFDGWVALDNEQTPLRAAPGVQKHIWGTRRVEELYWIYCPRFTEDPSAAFEATAVRAQRGRGLGIAPVWLRADGVEHRLWGVPGVFRNRVEPTGPGRLRAEAQSLRTRIVAEAACDPQTLAGYVYRDPAGGDVHVAQSDVASCSLEIATRSSPFGAWQTAQRLTGPLAAVEFHHPEPLPGVRYVPWDATSV